MNGKLKHQSTEELQDPFRMLVQGALSPYRPPKFNAKTSAIQSSFFSIALFYLSGDHFHMINLFNHKNTYIHCLLICNKKNRILLLNYGHSVSGIYEYQGCNSLFNKKRYVFI